MFQWVSDGLVLSVIGAIFILLLIRRQLSEMPRWVAWCLVGILLTGAIVRVLISPAVQMEARPWSNTRVFLLANLVYGGPVLALLSRSGRTFYLTDVIFTTNLALAIAMPAVLFAHARLLLNDHRCALAAAALVALLPMHIRFSHSDIAQVQSLVCSSFTFVTLYTMLTDRSPAWRVAGVVLLPVISLATYAVRPENIVFFPLDLAGIYVVSRKGIPRRRAAVAVVIVAVAAYFGFSSSFAGRVLNFGNVVTALFSSVRALPNPYWNTLINPTMTPPVMMGLAVAGTVFLYRRDPFRALFLLGWLASFFVGESLVLGETQLMQTRYHTHLITPFVLLAAAATPEVLAMTPLVRIGIAGLLVTAPVVHLPFETNVAYFEIREFQFIESLRHRIPDGCTVLEFQPTLSEGELEASRVARLGARVHDGRRENAWTVVPLGRLGANEEEENLSPEAIEILAQPGGCTMFYEGLTCYSHRSLVKPQARVCSLVAARRRSSLIAESEIRGEGIVAVGVIGRLRDTPFTRIGPPGVIDGASVPLRLYALDGGRAPAGGT